MTITLRTLPQSYTSTLDLLTVYHRALILFLRLLITNNWTLGTVNSNHFRTGKILTAQNVKNQV